MLAGLTFVQLLILIIVVAACIGITVVVLKVIGWSPPGWFITICWIVAAAVIGILAIKFVASMW